MEFEIKTGNQFVDACWACNQPHQPEGVFCDRHGPEDVEVTCSACGAELRFDEISARYSETGGFVCIDCYD